MNSQDAAWAGPFGREYLDRNPKNARQMDEWTEATFGVSRDMLNKSFLADLPKDLSILEVGSNIGAQLELLQWGMGFKQLSGIELSEEAVKIAASRSIHINYWYGTAHDLPFKDKLFDLVFTSGVLIHIHPDNLLKVMWEIYRCSSKYIWGFEYYANEPTTIRYRDRDDLLWKRDFAQHYLDTFEDLRLVKMTHVPYVKGSNIDCMFLLEKR